MLQDKNKPALSILAIITLGLIVYSNTFFNSFHFDDYPQVINNAALKDIYHWQGIWDFWPTRFVTYFSFALNYHWGRLNVEGYHIVSLAVHVGVSLLVWWLTLLTFESPLIRKEKIAAHAPWIAFFTGTIFLVHPVQTQPINYIYQRSVLLSAFFYLGALIFYIKARKPQSTSSPKAGIFYAASLAAAVLSVFSKETAVTLPLMICFYESYFLKAEGNFKWRMVIPFFSVLILLPITWLSMHPEIFTGIKTAVEGYAGGVSAKEYALTQLKVMVTYIRLIFIPAHQAVEYDYVLVKSIFEPLVILSAAFLLFVLLAAFRISRKYPLMAFGIFWFFITLLPESSFWPNQDLIFEHRLYLPLMGFCIFLSSGAFYFVRSHTGLLAVRILFLFVLVYAVMAYQRNRVWHDELSLWDDAVHQSPKDARAYLNRGAAYQSQGDLDHAMEDYNMVIGLGPITAVTLSNRGSIFRQKGDYEHALANFNLAIKINSSYAGTYVNRGSLYRTEGKLDLALADLDLAVKLIPNDADAHILRGRILEELGNVQAAHEEFQKGQMLRNPPEF